MKPLVMFPGQGSQRPGMAAELLDRFADAAGPVYALADEVLGVPLTRLCLGGSAEELRRTDITQPAILATSLAILKVLRSHGFEPTAAVGHSLGEYGALAAAGVLTLASALQLVRRRGELMAQVGDAVSGAMAAVIGLPSEQVEQLCAEADGGSVVEVANYNEPLQTVISGHADGVEQVTQGALAANAERVMSLMVSAPFHCSLMRSAEEEFSAELEQHAFADPRIPVLSALTANYVRSGQEARLLLGRQLTAPVRWVDTLRRAVAGGYKPLLEVGPGQVLAGFAKRIAPEVSVYGTGNARWIEALLGRIETGPQQPAIA